MKNLLDKKDACKYLNVTEQELEKLVEKGEITAYKVGGVYLRFKQGELERINLTSNQPVAKSGPFDKVLDFLYYNDFYIFCLIIIFLLLAILFKVSL